jgi:hypothetical protein
MKKLIFLFTILIFHSYAAFSQQEASIRYGSEMFKPSAGTSFRVIGNWDDGVIMQSSTRDKLFSAGKTYMSRFDGFTLLPQYSKVIELETSKGNKSLEYQVFERLGNHPVLFATYFNKDRDKIELYGRRYTIEGEPTGRESKIAEYPASRKSEMDALQFVQSNDSTKMLAFFSKRIDKYSSEKINFHLFDQDLNVVWNRDIEFPYKGRNFNIHRSMVDPSGRVYLLVRIQLEKEEMINKSDPPFRYSLVTFSDESSLVEDYEIKLADNFITDIAMHIDNKGKITCSGFYSTRGNGKAAGIFYLNVDRETKSVENKSQTEFDPSFTLSFLESSRIRGKAELSDFKLDHFLKFEDGSFGLVAEQFLIDEICIRDFRTGMINCTYYYYYNNIIVVKIDAEGGIEWTADIPKYQESSNDGGFFSSYAFGFDGKAFHFLFNDNPKNLTETDSQKAHRMTNIRKAVPVYARIGKDGSFKREVATNEKRNKFYFVPFYSSQISDRSMWVIGITSNKYRAGVLSFR